MDRHLDHHHLDVARQRCYLPEPPTWNTPSSRSATPHHIMARELVESTMKGCHIDEYEVLPETVLGSELELMQYQHPFLDRKGLVIPGRPCHPRRRHRLCPHRPRPWCRGL